MRIFAPKNNETGYWVVAPKRVIGCEKVAPKGPKFLSGQAEEQVVVFNQDDAEEHAMLEILGNRQDWYVGIGPVVPRSSWAIAQAQDESSSSGSGSSRRRVPDPVVGELQAQVAAQQLAMAAQQQQMEEMQRQMFAFTQQFSPLPQMSSGTMPQMPQMSPGMMPQMPQTTPSPQMHPMHQTTPTSVSMADAQTTPPASAEFQRERTSGSGRGGSSSSGARFGGRGSKMFKEWFTNRGKGKGKE